MTVPIITTTKATVPVGRSSGWKAAEQRAPSQHVLALLEDRDPREEVEVDRERLAAAAPRLDAEPRHPGPGEHAVGDRRGGQARGVLAPPRRELDPGEDQQPGGRGPAAEALGVGMGRRAPDQRTGRAGDGPPRVQRMEEVAEEHARERHPDPEHDQDEDRSEVRERVGRADVAGADDDREQQRAQRAAGDLDGARAERAGRSLRAAGARRPAPDAGATTARPSAAKETASTTAAAKKNSHSGSGRFARWTSPWAWAASGTASAAAAARMPARAISAGWRRRP